MADSETENAMAFKLRRYNFFDKEVVKDPETNENFEKLKDVSVTCSSSGRGQLVLGDVEGHVIYINRQLQMSGFKAYVLTIEFLQQMRENSLLVTVGADEKGINPLIKVWNQEKADKQGIPLCVRIVRAVAGINVSPVKSLAVHENLNLMAVGFDDGNVLLFRGDITRDRQSKQTVLRVGTSPVNALAFLTVNRPNQQNSHLFAGTASQVVSVNLAVRDKETMQVLDSHGCSPQCATMSVVSDPKKEDSQFIVGRQEAVYFYHPEGRGSCLAFEEEKVILRWFRNYLVLVCKDAKAPVAAGAAARSGLEKTVVTIYDIQNKFVAYSALIPGVVDVFFEWGSLFVLVQDGKMYCLQEKDTQSKLEVLFKKNQYSLAISLAKSQQYDEDGLIDIFRQYGDHLYSKGDHEGAVQMYIKTIGKLEASYVIRKFLDAQRINNLTEYLQELHRKGAASEDHTTLLLNCYIRLDENDKLTQFIMTEGRAIDFDVETAIRVCRQAGYFSQALYLAEKHGCDDLYLHIQLENCRDYLKALHYISRLPFREAEDYMKKYGKVLLNEIPEETTHLLKRLCTDYRPSNAPLVNQSMLDGAPPPQEQKSHPEDFIHIFVNKSDKLLEFLEHMVKVQPNSSSLVYNTLLELHLQVHNHEPDSAEKKLREQKIMDMLRSWESMYDLDQAMVLCQMNNFRRGILHLYEKAKLYQQILSYHIENSEYDSVIKICERFGTNDPNLWIQALWFFAQAGESQKTYFKTVLEQIEKGKLLPPIMVVEIASRSQTATLSLIKDYLIRHLQSENRQTEENERLMNQYKEDTAKARSEIEDLRHNPKIFQVSKCCGCNHQLELPSVHFLCGHSYHQHCFENYAESDTECPECLAKNSKTLDILRSQEQTKDLHEQFHHLLERSEDGFSVVAEYLGKGLFNKVTLLTDGAGAPHSKPGPRNARPPTGSGLPLHVQRDVLLQ